MSGSPIIAVEVSSFVCAKQRERCFSQININSWYIGITMVKPVNEGTVQFFSSDFKTNSIVQRRILNLFGTYDWDPEKSQYVFTSLIDSIFEGEDEDMLTKEDKIWCIK